MTRSTRTVFVMILACFFVSVAAALVYEIVWARYLALSLGHASYAVVAVLAAFMGGMAIGNAWAGVWGERVLRPLAWYGWIEVTIGVYALLFPSYYALAHRAFIALARGEQPGSVSLFSLKFAFSLFTLLLPTVLIGATMPVLAKFVTRSLSELREKIAALYFVNSAGAVAGCVLADFWWIPAFGLPAAVVAGAVLNLAAGAGAFLLSSRSAEARNAAATCENVTETNAERFTPAEIKLAVVAIGVSG